MTPRKDAALRILQWDLEGHGNEVLQAMLSHPDMSLSDAVDMIEKENPAWTDGERAGSAERKREPEEHPEPEARRGRSTPEVVALQQEFATFRHLLPAAEAKEIEAALRAIEARPSPDDLAAVRRRLRTLALQAAFWRELAIPTKLPNALGVMLLRVEGGGLVAQGGSTDYFGDERIAHAVRGGVGRQGRGGDCGNPRPRGRVRGGPAEAREARAARGGLSPAEPRVGRPRRIPIRIQVAGVPLTRRHDDAA